MTKATHDQNTVSWSLSPAQKHTKERLYSGKDETVVLTVTILNPIPPPLTVARTGSPWMRSRSRSAKTARASVARERTVDRRAASRVTRNAIIGSGQATQSLRQAQADQRALRFRYGQATAPRPPRAAPVRAGR